MAPRTKCYARKAATVGGFAFAGAGLAGLVALISGAGAEALAIGGTFGALLGMSWVLEGERR